MIFGAIGGMKIGTVAKILDQHEQATDSHNEDSNKP
jgi:hypothetical protein